MLSLQKILMFLCAFIPAEVFGQSCMGCRQNQVHRMHSADCYDKDLKEIPTCLRTNVEVLDLSFNRIRKIEKDDLQSYSSVKFLYLSDNMITRIDESAFEGLDSLTVLDLSLNGFVNLPATIFQLPSLKKLYLSNNQNINIAEAIERAKPITSPLEYLDISYNEIQALPDIGILPALKAYNISGNKLSKFVLRDIAGLCSLEKLINDDFASEFDSPCDCWTLIKWMRDKKIQFKPFGCPVEEEACFFEKISDEDISQYQECLKQHDTIILKSKLLTLYLPIAGVILLFVLVVIFIIWRKKRKPRKKSGYNNNIHALIKDEDGDLLKKTSI